MTLALVSILDTVENARSPKEIVGENFNVSALLRASWVCWWGLTQPVCSWLHRPKLELGEFPDTVFQLIRHPVDRDASRLLL